VFPIRPVRLARREPENPSRRAGRRQAAKPVDVPAVGPNRRSRTVDLIPSEPTTRSAVTARPSANDNLTPRSPSPVLASAQAGARRARSGSRRTHLAIFYGRRNRNPAKRLNCINVVHNLERRVAGLSATKSVACPERQRRTLTRISSILGDEIQCSFTTLINLS
jgi:hypothetical protein